MFSFLGRAALVRPGPLLMLHLTSSQFYCCCGFWFLHSPAKQGSRCSSLNTGICFPNCVAPSFSGVLTKELCKQWRGGITPVNNVAREPKDAFVGVPTWYNPANSPAAVCQHLPRGVPQSAWQGGWGESTKRSIKERRKGREKSRMGRERKQSKGRRVTREEMGLGRAQQRKEMLLWCLWGKSCFSGDL